LGTGEQTKRITPGSGCEHSLSSAQIIARHSHAGRPGQPLGGTQLNACGGRGSQQQSCPSPPHWLGVVPRGHGSPGAGMEHAGSNTSSTQTSSLQVSASPHATSDPDPVVAPPLPVAPCVLDPALASVGPDPVLVAAPVDPVDPVWPLVLASLPPFESPHPASTSRHSPAATRRVRIDRPYSSAHREWSPY